MTSQPLWIHRKISDQIYDQIVADEPKIVVWLIQSPAGMGKTYLARDIGVRLSSPTGYEPAQQGRLLWSGILDLYDPTTNSNRGIEQRLIEALSVSDFEFEEYQAQRELYTALFKGGISGPGLEEQRRKIEAAFAAGLQEVSKSGSPILVFDTTERLENASDPTQRVLGFIDDTASVMGWLVAQIILLRSGSVLLLGRQQDRFHRVLAEKIEQANKDSARTGLPPIELRSVVIQPLDADELSLFFENRVSRFPPLRLLDADLRQLLGQRTGGNPLLLDLALQAYLETANPVFVRRTLTDPAAISSLAHALVKAYITCVENSERHLLLRYLALCRNGVYADLLRALEPERAERLIETLRNMEELPFIKVRDVLVETGDKPVQRRTYFFHDAMYSLCEEVLLTPQQAQDDSRRLLRWYEERLEEARQLESSRPRGERRSVPSPDLLVESLFYSMRADPVIGYNRYLQLADGLIRGAETGLDMRLHDALAQFVTSATAKQIPALEQNAGSSIDRENLRALMPELPDLYEIDSATLWIKRFTVRGKQDLAEKIGRTLLPQVRQACHDNPTLFRLTAADFLLWFGQALMYGPNVQEAVKIYEEAIDLLAAVGVHAETEGGPAGELENLASWRTSLVLGRLHNNLGYTYWMNFGQYNRAILEFQLAIGLFRLRDLPEEHANSNDNLGRVYALQGRRFQAIQLIENGLEIRKELGLSYREALSANSLALALARFGEFDLALRAANDALAQFGRVGVKRGIGLGLLCRGMIYRSLAENWLDNSLPLDEGIKYADLAETDLREAWSIFVGAVSEPIRLAQALNELACCYRARYQLVSLKGDAEAVRKATLAQGRIRFLQAIKQANESGFLIEELDSMQDLAVLFFRAKNFAEAQQYLDKTRQKIAATYPGHIIQPGVEQIDLDASICVDVCYKLMGQVELLEGTIVYESGREKAQAINPAAKLPEKPDLLAAAEHFLLAVSYFNRYSGEDYARRLTYRRIYRRFKGCDPSLIEEILDVYLPNWVKRYDLPEELVRSYFLDVFGLFILPGKGR